MSEYKYKTMDKNGDWGIWKEKPILASGHWYCDQGGGKVLNAIAQSKHSQRPDWTVGLYSPSGFDFDTGISYTADTQSFQGEGEPEDVDESDNDLLPEESLTANVIKSLVEVVGKHTLTIRNNRLHLTVGFRNYNVAHDLSDLVEIISAAEFLDTKEIK